MPPWSPQLFEKEARKAGASRSLIDSARKIAGDIRAKNAKIPPVFTLRHLASLTGVNYGLLRAIISRENSEPYRIFRIHKRPDANGVRRYRTIAVPSPGLLTTQRWINQKILSLVTPHPSSVAYSKGSTILAAAQPHSGARWLIKLDVRNFFESINEIDVYRVFRSIGYQPLISFEMTRLCTRLGRFENFRSRARWSVDWKKWGVIKAYTVFREDSRPNTMMRMGHLPQGAPTSPMLANLAARQLDKRLEEIASDHGLIYTRYADDITLSTVDESFSRQKCSVVIAAAVTAMRKFGLSSNSSKTKISPPGARKVVLGLVVDGDAPRLRRTLKMELRQHIHFLLRDGIGPTAHAKARKFASVDGLKNYLYGLLSFAQQIEPEFAASCAAKLSEVDWPI